MRPLKTLFFVASVCAAGLALPALAGTISVTGEATVNAAPDMATVSFGVTTDGQTAAEAMAKNNAALAAVMQRLRGAGIAENDLQTASLTLSPNWVGYDGSSTPKIAGYMASNMLNVRVRDLSVLGSILDASITDGANTLNGITFEVADAKPLQAEARKAAVGDARERAAQLAEAAGLTLGKIDSIVENAGYGAPMPVFKAAADGAAATPIASGQVGMSASVTVVFQTE